MSGVRLKYQRSTTFHDALKARVDDYFSRTGRIQRGLPRMYLKTACIVGWLALSYYLLVFEASRWWHTAPLLVSLGLAMAAVGFNVQHDGGHGSFSRSRKLNRTMAFALDLIGGSSYLWHWKHNILHHSYPNIVGADDDINVGPVARLAPEQPRFRLHRFQHIYIWFLYGFIPFKWQLVDDFVDLVRGRVGQQPIPRPKRGELALLVLGKTIFFTLAFVIPLLRHPVWVVLVAYVAVSFMLGVILGTVFQLAHCVEPVIPHARTPVANRLDSEWAVHQIESTVDFARSNPLLTWFLGGLNFQIEHHLFPRVCHVHYPALATIVEKTCREFGVGYAAYPTFAAAMASHFRFLRTLGRPDLPAPAGA